MYGDGEPNYYFRNFIISELFPYYKQNGKMNLFGYWFQLYCLYYFWRNQIKQNLNISFAISNKMKNKCCVVFVNEMNFWAVFSKLIQSLPTHRIENGTCQSLNDAFVIYMF